MPDTAQPLRILHLEDSARDAGLIHDKLEDAGLSCAISRVDSRPEFENALDCEAFDLILCDYNLPGYDGLSALKRARTKQPHTPLIMISGSLGEEQAVECLHLGATDYLLKQRMERFIPAVRRALHEAEAVRARRKAEIELRESEERHRLMFQSSPLAMWVYDLDSFRFLAVNRTAVRQYGYSEAEFLSMTIPDIRPPGDLAHLESTLSELGPEKTAIATWRHQKKSGEIIDVEVSSEPMVFGDRRARLVLARDITERLVAERTRRRLAAVIAFSLDIAREHELSSAIRKFARAARDVVAARLVLVLTVDEKTNRWNSESYGWESPDAADNSASAALSELVRGLMAAGLPVRESASNDSYMARRLATLFPGFHSYLGVPLTANARTVGWCSLLNKIEGQEFTQEDEEVAFSFSCQMALTLQGWSSEKALDAAEQRYRDIFRFAPAGIYQADQEGRLLLANEAMAGMLGFESADQLIGTSLRDLFTDYEEHVRARFHVAPSKPPFIEEKMRRRDGSEICIRGVVRIVRDERGEVLCEEAYFRDITEQKASEQQVRLLQQAVERAKRVDSLGRVAATIAHEFNNVLTGIQPFAEVIQRRTGDDPAMTKAAASIIHSVRRGKGVTSSILRFTNPTAPNRQIIHAAEWLSRLETELRQLVGSACRLEMELPDSSVSFPADPQQMEQVLSNLVLNARQAMKEGGTIRVRCSPADPGKVFSFGTLDRRETFVELSVTDDGSGIPDDIIGHVFDPLFTTKRTGTGLGLSVVAQAVEHHGGKIGVESAPGKGTTFYILLPGADRGFMGGSRAPTPSRRLPQRLLLVDADVAVTEGLAALLKLQGIDVTVAGSGAGVGAAVERFQPDCVVLDLGLPDMDGTAVKTMLQNRWPQLPVVVSSGRTSQPQGEPCPAIDLQKPYPYETLLQVISRAVERRSWHDDDTFAERHGLANYSDHR